MYPLEISPQTLLKFNTVLILCLIYTLIIANLLTKISQLNYYITLRLLVISISVKISLDVGIYTRYIHTTLINLPLHL